MVRNRGILRAASIPGIRWMFPRTGIVGGPAYCLAYLFHKAKLAAAEEVSLLKLVKLSR